MPAKSAKEIAWVVGLLEGEGSFRWHPDGTAVIVLGMTDRDVVEHFKQVTQTPSVISIDTSSKNKPMYRVRLFGSLAIQWMLTLYSLLGNRRREQIRNVIAQWKSYTPRAERENWFTQPSLKIGDYCKHGHLVKGFNVRKCGTNRFGTPNVRCRICSIGTNRPRDIVYRNHLIARHIAEFGPVREDSSDATEQSEKDIIKALKRLGISREAADEVLRKAQQQGGYKNAHS